MKSVFVFDSSGGHAVGWDPDGAKNSFTIREKRTSEDIDTFLMEGHIRLKITRSGSGVDTRYLIVPV